MNQYKPPCSSKAADGAIRGALIGLVWGGVFASPPLPAEAGASVGASALKRAGRVGGSMLRHGGGFAAFLAVYNGVTCTAEAARGGKDDALNAALGGFSAGALAAMRVRNPLHALAVAGGTGCFTAAIYTMRGGSGDGL